METIERLASGMTAGLDLMRLEGLAGDLADCTLALDHQIRACERLGDEVLALETRRTRRVVDHLYHLLCARLDSVPVKTCDEGTAYDPDCPVCQQVEELRATRVSWGGGQLDVRPWTPEAREL